MPFALSVSSFLSFFLSFLSLVRHRGCNESVADLPVADHGSDNIKRLMSVMMERMVARPTGVVSIYRLHTEYNIGNSHT